MSRILVISLTWLLCSCAPHGRGTYFTSGIRNYTGDGTIQDTSQRSGILQTRGYLVALPHFPLNRSYEHTFQLDGLPTIESKQIEIVFLVPETFSQTRTANAHSTVEFTLSTSDDKRVTNLNSTLRALIWSSPVHDHSGYALYHLDRSFFQPVSGERYRLHVRYSPAPGADSGDGYFYLWSGIGGS